MRVRSRLTTSVVTKVQCRLVSSSTTRSSTTAGSSSRSGPGEDDAPFTGWSVRSPKDLYNHLSQYIVGQERAKRILSVAVFNHYHRIAPRLPPQEPPPPPTPSPQPRPQPPPIVLDPPIASSPSSPSRHSGSWDRLPSSSGFRRDVPSPNANIGSGTSSSPGDNTDALAWDPSRGGSQLEDGRKQRDATKVTGAGADGADPTLTHDMLTFRSREGQWARNGYFSAKSPPSSSQTSLLGQAIKQRKSSSHPPTPTPTASEAQQTSTNSARSRRKRVEIEPDQKPPILEDEPPISQKEEVVIEKSNVLMIGPTGTGKTLMARTLANILDVPFASCDATSYTQAGYVGEDVENCVLRLLQNAEYDVNRAEVGIIHIDEIDKLARRGGGDAGSWGGGRDVGGEGVQQALLRLLEGTSLTLSAKPPPITSTSTPSGGGSPFTPSGGSSSGTSISGPKAESLSAFGDPPGWDPNNPMNRNVGGKKSVREGLPGFSSGGGNPGGKGETFVVDTTNILFVLSGAFVGLDSIVNRRLGKGSIGFGAPLPKPPPTSSSASSNPLPLTGLSTQDLSSYGLIPEFLGRLPVLSVLHPLSIEDLICILVEPRNALIKQYMAMFERYGSSLKFTEKAVREIAKEGLERGGGARGLRGVLEETLVDAMFEVPGSSVRYCLITEEVVKKQEPALYFSRGQRMQYLQAVEDEDGKTTIPTGLGAEVTSETGEDGENLDAESEPQRISATG
ncbi:hypothetical protein IAT40_001420 [Kwoniella sp. CBS 6097]